MRLAVAGGCYDTAADAFVGGNQLAATAYRQLTGALAGCGSMAGDDATSTDFASEYDGAAREAVGAVADLVLALARCAELTAASVDNHRRADADSQYGAPTLLDCGPPPSGSPVEVSPYTPPSALGGNPGGEPDHWDLVVDHLQGLAWPNADTTRLRSAAATWRRAATDVGTVATYCDTALAQLEGQVSPEIPVAEAATRDLRQTCGDLADVLSELGQACDDYATQVEEHRDVIIGILEALAVEAGISLGIGIVTGLVTFGGGTAAGGAVAAWRVVAAARKVAAALSALEAAAEAVAVARLARVVSRVRPLRALLGRFTTARSLRRAGEAVERTSTMPLKHDPRQLQKKYKHAKEFGVEGSYSPANAHRFRQALDDFVEARGTITRQGTYRDQAATLHYDLETRRCVVQSPDGSFVSAWKLSPQQLHHVTTSGRLGGG